MKNITKLLLLLFMAGLLSINSCTKDEELKIVSISVTLPEGGARPLIATVTLRITAPGFEDYEATQSVPQSATVVTFEVQLEPGNSYTFFVTARDSGGSILYWGRIVGNPDQAVNFEINMEPAAHGAANHIKIFRDNLPWESTAMDSMLASQGYSPGQGENQYEVLTSADFDTVTLRVGRDLVIIVNDQNQNFYDNYARNMSKFNNFVAEGGVIFWEACDRGWHGGSILDAGITFPGGVLVDTVYYYDNYNLIYNHSYELVQGLPDTLYGTYSSHETFNSLPENSQIFTVNREMGRPTLVLYNFGLGWVMVTGQPLEYNYDRLPDQTTGLLLPRIVNLILGNQGGGEEIIHSKKVSSRVSGM